MSVSRGCFVAALCCVSSLAEERAPKAKSPVKRISATEYQIGLVAVDRAKREARIPAKVNMTEGLVELLICTSFGKTHESVFVTEAKPIHIQTALLLLGARAGKAGAASKPPGDRFEILVAEEGKAPSHGERFVWHEKGKRPMARTAWVFTGSRIREGQFMADIDGSIVATYHDPLAILNNPLPTNADDETYFVNEKVVPPAGSKVTLILRKLPEQGKLK